MHVAIEKARKAAGISSMRNNYPEDPKQRGPGFWAAFIGVIQEELTQRDARLIEARRMIAELERERTDLEREIAEVQAQECSAV